MRWYLKVLTKHYADFQSRARRKEYWMFTLFNSLIIGILFLMGIISNSDFMTVAIPIVLLIYYVLILVPSLAVTARRLHDIGKSGWLLLVYFIPFVGNIILLILTCLDSQPGANRYGPNPKVGFY